MFRGCGHGLNPETLVRPSEQYRDAVQTGKCPHLVYTAHIGPTHHVRLPTHWARMSTGGPGMSIRHNPRDFAALHGGLIFMR